MVQLAVLVGNPGGKQSFQRWHYLTKSLLLEDSNSIEWIKLQTKANQYILIVLDVPDYFRIRFLNVGRRSILSCEWMPIVKHKLDRQHVNHIMTKFLVNLAERICADLSCNGFRTRRLHL